MINRQRATQLLADVERKEALARTPLVERLALLGTFDPDQLVDREAEDVVARLCERLKPADRGPEWTLGERVRVDAWTALLRRGGPGLLAHVRRSIAPHYDTALQRMLDAFALGRSVPLEERDEDELAASLRVWRWATEAAARAEVTSQMVIGPDRDAIESRLSLLAVTRAVRRLAAEGCVGRSAELDRLHDYRTSRTTGLFGDPAMVVYGIGGVGKSTLLARFVMDLFEAGQRGEPHAWAYLDMDRPTLASYTPEVILDDIISQVAAQFPAWRRQLYGKRIDVKHRKTGAGLESYDSAVVRRRDHRVRP